MRQRHFAAVAIDFDHRLQRRKCRDIDARADKHAEHADHGIAPAFAARGHAGAGTKPEDRQAGAEEHAADDDARQRSGLNVKRRHTHRHERMNADGAHRDRRRHDLHHGEILQQKLADDLLEFRDLPFLQEEAEDDAGQRARARV